MAVVPRTVPSVPSSAVVATAATPYPDSSGAWCWLWVHPSQPLWISACSECGSPASCKFWTTWDLANKSSFQSELTRGHACSFATKASWAARDEGEEGAPKVSVGEENLHSSLLNKAVQRGIPSGSANSFVSTTWRAQSQGGGDAIRKPHKLSLTRERWKL